MKKETTKTFTVGNVVVPERGVLPNSAVTELIRTLKKIFNDHAEHEVPRDHLITLRKVISHNIRSKKSPLAEEGGILEKLTSAIASSVLPDRIPREDLDPKRNAPDIRLRLRRKRNRPMFPPGDDHRSGGRG